MGLQSSVWPIFKVILRLINEVVIFGQTVAILSFHSSMSDIHDIFNIRQISILKRKFATYSHIFK